MITPQTVTIEFFCTLVEVARMRAHRIFGRISDYFLQQAPRRPQLLVLTARSELGKHALHVHGFDQILGRLLDIQQQSASIVPQRYSDVTGVTSAGARLPAIAQDCEQEEIA